MGRPSKRVRQLQQAQESKRHHRLPQVEHNEDNSDSTSAVDFDENYYLSSDIDDEQVEEGVKVSSDGTSKEIPGNSEPFILEQAGQRFGEKSGRKKNLSGLFKEFKDNLFFSSCKCRR
ncbi:hypothetical protein BASA83_010027 [Batrachochytrium salamandrivorans]|nr:hypothetical protein BASA83_010027 [Batrachochytrium salamandrivorans]